MTIVMPTRLPVGGVNFTAVATATVETRIYAGTSLSAMIDMTAPEVYGYTPLVVFVPSTWTAAKMSMQVSLDGTTWFDYHLYDKDFATKTINPSEALVDVTRVLQGIPYFKIRSGTSAAPTTQVSTVVLQVLCGTV